MVRKILDDPTSGQSIIFAAHPREGIELTAVNLLRAHLFGMPRESQRDIMRRIVCESGEIALNALVDTLNFIAESVAAELDEWVVNPEISPSLARRVKNAKKELLHKNFALLKNGTSPEFMRLLKDLEKMTEI